MFIIVKSSSIPINAIASSPYGSAAFRNEIVYYLVFVTIASFQLNEMGPFCGIRSLLRSGSPVYVHLPTYQLGNATIQ